MTKLTYKAIENATNEEIKEMYFELKSGSLPKDCKVRKLQSVLYNENKKTVALSSVQYQIAMETVKRFGNINV